MENSSPNPSFSICDIRIQKQISRSFGKSFPQKIVLPKLRPHCSATRLNTWKAEPRKKNTLSFFKRNSPSPKQKSKECFFFRGCRVKRGGGGVFVERAKKFHITRRVGCAHLPILLLPKLLSPILEIGASLV